MEEEEEEDEDEDEDEDEEEEEELDPLAFDRILGHFYLVES